MCWCPSYYSVRLQWASRWLEYAAVVLSSYVYFNLTLCRSSTSMISQKVARKAEISTNVWLASCTRHTSLWAFQELIICSLYTSRASKISYFDASILTRYHRYTVHAFWAKRYLGDVQEYERCRSSTSWYMYPSNLRLSYLRENRTSYVHFRGIRGVRIRDVRLECTASIPPMFSSTVEALKRTEHVDMSTAEPLYPLNLLIKSHNSAKPVTVSSTGI